MTVLGPLAFFGRAACAGSPAGTIPHRGIGTETVTAARSVSTAGHLRAVAMVFNDGGTVAPFDPVSGCGCWLLACSCWRSPNDAQAMLGAKSTDPARRKTTNRRHITRLPLN